MSSTSQMFTKLLPIDIKFLNGESPSPDKFNCIFNYIQAAFYMIESFLGNGVDYRMPIGDPADRKMLFNISQAFGNTGKIYKPLNRLVSLEYLSRNFGTINKNFGIDALHGAHTMYSSGTDELTVLEEINIPICTDTHGEWFFLGIYYTGAGSVTISGGNTDEEFTLTLPLKTHKTYSYIQIDAQASHFIDYIKISPLVVDGTVTQLIVSSMYLVKDSDIVNSVQRFYGINASGEENHLDFIDILQDYNLAYAVPIDNFSKTTPTFWTIKTPCKWAVTSVCSKKTCSYCIGNIYDIDVNNNNTKIGVPVCGGLYPNAIDPHLIPRDTRTENLGEVLTYTPNVYTVGTQAQIYTIQSPLCMTSKNYMLKYRPFMAHNLSAGSMLTKNETIIYDMSNRTSPIRYNMPIYSAGRPDIVFVADVNNELSPGSSSSVQIIGGAYSITSFIEDLVSAINITRNPQVAVFAD